MEVQGKYLKDEEGNVFSPVTNIKTIFNDTGINLLDLFYPIGSIYETLDGGFNPNISWGGTWELLSNGQVLIDSGYTKETSSTIIQASIGDKVGEKWHTLTIREMPTHTHTFTGISDSHAHGFQKGVISYTAENSACSGVEPGPAWKEGINLRTQTLGTNITPRGTNSSTGNGKNFELTPKGLIVARWHRTA